MIDDLMGTQRLEVNITHLRGPLQIIELRHFILVFNPSTLNQSIAQVTIPSLDNKHFTTTFNTFGFLPCIQVSTAFFLLRLIIIR
jgi:hypothetical protein